jgi:hypothetical protein
MFRQCVCLGQSFYTDAENNRAMRNVVSPPISGATCSAIKKYSSVHFLCRFCHATWLQCLKAFDVLDLTLTVFLKVTHCASYHLLTAFLFSFKITLLFYFIQNYIIVLFSSKITLFYFHPKLHYCFIFIQSYIVLFHPKLTLLFNFHPKLHYCFIFIQYYIIVLFLTKITSLLYFIQN